MSQEHTLENSYNTYIYSVLPDINIYTRAYFREVLLNMELEEPYYFMFGDFRNLGKLNAVVGEAEGTKRLVQSLKIILKTLPVDTISSRIAGDEFAFIIPKTTMEKEMSDYVLDITSALHKERAVAIDLAYVSSENYPSRYDMLIATEKAVTKIKVDRNTYQLSPEETPEMTLRRLLEDNTDSILKTFRLEEKLGKEEVFILSKMIAKDILQLFKNKNLQPDPLNEYYGVKPGSSINLDSKQLRTLHRYLMQDSQEHFSEPWLEEKAKELMQFLIRNPLSHLYNLAYFQKFFLPQVGEEDKFRLLFYEVSGLKISNTNLGFEKTDEQLSTALSTLRSSLDSKIDFSMNSTPFQYNPHQNYAFDLSEGKIAVLLAEDFPVLNRADVYTALFDARKSIDPKSGLSVTCYYIDTPSSQIEETIEKAHLLCKGELDLQKSPKMHSETGTDILSKLLKPSVSYFLEHYPSGGLTEEELSTLPEEERIQKQEERTKARHLLYQLLSTATLESINKHNRNITLQKSKIDPSIEEPNL